MSKSILCYFKKKDTEKKAQTQITLSCFEDLALKLPCFLT